MRERPLTEALAAPMIWGLSNGWSLADVARGLGVRQLTVVEAAEAFGPPWLARLARREWLETGRIDPIRAETDWAYGNWARARLGASEILNAMGEM